MNLAQARKLKRGDRVFYDVENGARGMVKKHVLPGVWIHWEGRPKAILHLRTDLKEVRLETRPGRDGMLNSTLGCGCEIRPGAQPGPGCRDGGIEGAHPSDGTPWPHGDRRSRRSSAS